MQLRHPHRSAVATSALALLAACHGGSPSPASGSVPAYWSASDSTPGPFAQPGAAALITVPGLGNDFTFAPGASLVDDASGRAFLVGVLERRSVPAERLAVSLRLANPLRPGQPNYDALASPRADLAPSAYVAAGGPVDVRTWTYYGIAGGELRGLGTLAGALFDLAAADATGVQLGIGADNLAVALGASVQLAAVVVSQPQSGASTGADGTVLMACAVRTSDRTYAITSAGDAALGGLPRAALSMPALGGDFEVVAGGAFSERSDGMVHFDAILAATGAPERRFALTLLGRARIEAIGGAPPPLGSPHLELSPLAYRQSGGPIDVATWRYYPDLDGRLHGLDTLAGAEVRLRNGAFALQAGYGANGIDGALGASVALELDVVAQPLAAPPLPLNAGTGELRVALRRAYIATAEEPIMDPVYGTVGGFALQIPGIADDFTAATGGEFCERGDEAAELYLELRSLSSPAEQWVLDLVLGGRVDAGEAGGVPAGSPVLGLTAGAYVDNGGPIDPDRWHYYTLVTGQLRGLGPRAGAVVAVSSGVPVTQIGRGANGSNLEFGLWGTLQLAVVTQPSSGPPLVDPLPAGELVLHVERLGNRCVIAAQRDAVLTPLLGDAAFTLPGIGSDFVFQPGATLSESADGRADLRGVLVRTSNASQRFLVELRSNGRVDHHEVPPAGSPNLEMYPSAYVSAGGRVDPAMWHYYLESDGTLLGLDAWRGASVRLTRSGPALQVGAGANNKNAGYGASIGLVVEVLSQPDVGPALDSNGDADLNVNLLDGCP